jgi:hypothetical protein
VTHQHLLVRNHIPVGAYLISRAAIRRNFDERMRSHEDWEFLLHNIEPHCTRYVPVDIVTIDKTETMEESMQVRRKKFFWLDYLSVYSRYPAPQLSAPRKEALTMLGVNVDEQMLGQGDVI